MGHGGRRPGAGRKPNPLKDVRISAATAEKILRELGHEQEIVKLYRECGDARLKVQILFRLREWAYGKASQPLEHPGDNPVSGWLNCLSVSLADPRRPAAAKRTEAVVRAKAARQIRE